MEGGFLPLTRSVTSLALSPAWLKSPWCAWNQSTCGTFPPGAPHGWSAGCWHKRLIVANLSVGEFIRKLLGSPQKEEWLAGIAGVKARETRAGKKPSPSPGQHLRYSGAWSLSLRPRLRSQGRVLPYLCCIWERWSSSGPLASREEGGRGETLLPRLPMTVLRKKLLPRIVLGWLQNLQISKKMN